MFTIDNNENYEFCKTCGGRCCKNAGCSITAEDFQHLYGDITPEAVKEVLKNGYTALTYRSAQRYERRGYECNNDVYLLYYLKMRTEAADEFGFFTRGLGPCRALTHKGCEYSWDERPSGGKILVPAEDPHDCRILPSLEEEGIEDDVDFSIRSWLPHQAVLNEVANEYYSKGYEPDILEMFPEYHDD